MLKSRLMAAEKSSASKLWPVDGYVVGRDREAVMLRVRELAGRKDTECRRDLHPLGAIAKPEVGVDRVVVDAVERVDRRFNRADGHRVRRRCSKPDSCRNGTDEQPAARAGERLVGEQRTNGARDAGDDKGAHDRAARHNDREIGRNVEYGCSDQVDVDDVDAGGGECARRRCGRPGGSAG